MYSPDNKPFLLDYKHQIILTRSFLHHWTMVSVCKTVLAFLLTPLWVALAAAGFTSVSVIALFSIHRWINANTTMADLVKVPLWQRILAGSLGILIPITSLTLGVLSSAG